MLATTCVAVSVGGVVEAGATTISTIWITSPNGSPYDGDSLLSFPSSAGSSRAHAIVIVSSKDGSLHTPTGEAFDRAGDLWVANSSADDTSVPQDLVEYTPRQLAKGGAIAPHRVLTSAALISPHEIAFDAHGDVWVATSKRLVEFTPQELAAGGTQRPAVVISPPGVFEPFGVTFDSSGNLWATNHDGGVSQVVEYAKDLLTKGGRALTPTVTLSSDGTTSLSFPTGIAFDTSGDLYVGNVTAAVEFTASQLVTGRPRPVQRIRFGAHCDGMSFDHEGNLWIRGTGVYKFSEATWQQDSRPSELDSADGISPGGDIAVAPKTSTPSPTPYAGSPVAPPAPSAVPGVRSATVSWSPPHTAPPPTRPVTRYFVSVVSPPYTYRMCEWTSGPLECTFTGLSPKDTYQFSVQAGNAYGTSTPSPTSNFVHPTT